MQLQRIGHKMYKSSTCIFPTMDLKLLCPLKTMKTQSINHPPLLQCQYQLSEDGI